MTTRTLERGRITARAPQSLVEDLEEAAALVGVSVNQFIVQASVEKARAIIDSFARIEISRRDAAFIAGLLDDPPAPNEALRRAARGYRREVDHGDPDGAASGSSRH
ncbi:MAG: DUF1778 domain-containing protein [Candidatus Accumulibacter sp.]|jgi:uncharacterized protein (DUF1778 family)|nr:DUF1778 domain-containing protein [Accumulibacter sp.]